MKLETITESDKPGKKWTAVFIKDNGKTKTVHFGAKKNGQPMDDYTLTHDKAQRDRYRARHQKDLETGDPTRAGFLSYYLLWGDSTNLKTNIKKYVKKFNL